MTNEEQISTALIEIKEVLRHYDVTLCASLFKFETKKNEPGLLFLVNDTEYALVATNPEHEYQLINTLIGVPGLPAVLVDVGVTPTKYIEDIKQCVAIGNN